MKKKEVIQNSYGKAWNEVKPFVDENGWVKDKWIGHGVSEGISNEKLSFPFTDKDIHYKAYNGSDSTWRVNWLLGIETNNGWNKIESIDDLPKESGWYRTIDKDSDYMNSTTSFETDASEERWVRQFSHWKEIPDEPRPIY